MRFKVTSTYDPQGTAGTGRVFQSYKDLTALFRLFHGFNLTDDQELQCHNLLVGAVLVVKQCSIQRTA